MTEPHKEVLADGVEIWLGDCRDVLPLIGRVDAVVTDPPYGISLGEGDQRRNGHGLGKAAYCGFDDTEENFASIIIPLITLALDNATRGLVFCPGHRMRYLPQWATIGGIFVPAASGRHIWGFNCLITAALYGKAPALNLGAKRSAFESNETAEDNGHPCPKPLGWMKWAIDLSSLRGETVLDPFMGSGTTGVACVNLGRKFIGIEIGPKYYDIARRRITDALNQPRLALDEPRKVVQPSFLDASE